MQSKQTIPSLKRGMKPEHPGAILKNAILPELDITQLELSKRLGVSRRTISEIIREQRPVTADMAMRLAKVFNTTPRFWLNLLAALWKLDNAKAKAYAKIVPFPVSPKRKTG